MLPAQKQTQFGEELIMPVRVVVTRKLPALGEQLLTEAERRGEIEVVRWSNELPPFPQELKKLLTGAEGVISLLTEPMTAEVFEREPQLKVVSNLAVGFDNIDVPAATKHKVAVCNTPGVLTNATADMAFTLLMAAARRVSEAIDYVRTGKWETWSPTLLLGQEITGTTLGIVGFGRIGKEMARRGTGFGMRLLAYDEYKDEEGAAEIGVTFTSLQELLKESDFVSLHCTLTPETRHLIGGAELAMMKPSAILINASRGPVVDTDALAAALKDGTIWAAGLDVTDPEPIPADHPLVTLPNCIVVPHIASGTIVTRDEMARLAVENCLAVLNGTTPPHCVNPEVLA
jgi:glyoxylate reductase